MWGIGWGQAAVASWPLYTSGGTHPGHGAGGDMAEFHVGAGGDRQSGGFVTGGDYPVFTGTGGDKPTGGG